MYRYEDERPTLFTERGAEMLMQIRDRVGRVVRESGAITLGAAVRGTTGDTFQMQACVDRLVERGELREVTKGQDVAGQDRIFVPVGSWWRT